MLVNWHELQVGMVVYGFSEHWIIYLENGEPKNVLQVSELPKPLIVVGVDANEKKKAIAMIRGDGFCFAVGTGDVDHADWFVLG